MQTWSDPCTWKGIMVILIPTSQCCFLSLTMEIYTISKYAMDKAYYILHVLENTQQNNFKTIKCRLYNIGFIFYVLYSIWVNHLIVILLAIRITLGGFPKSFSIPLSASTKKNRRVKSQLFILLPSKKHDSFKHVLFNT